MKLFGEKIFDWGAINEIPPSDRKEAIIARVNEFMEEIESKEITSQKIVGTDPNLGGPAPVVLVQSDTLQAPDRGYEILFDEFDMRESSSSSFEVLDVTGGITFFQVVEGEEAKLSRIPKTAKTAVSYLRFIGGFPILDDWLRFNEYYKIDQLTADTVKRWWDKKATIFYGLLTALTGIDEAFDTDDVTTINKACANILNDLQAAGYAVDENSQFVITCNPLLRARIFKAINASFVNPNSNNNQIVFNISAVISTTKVASTNYWVSLPGGKNLRGEWDDLNIRPPQRNELKLGADHVWTGAYNGIIAEKKQHRKCALS